KHRVITILFLCFVGLGAGFVQCTRIGYLIFYILDVRVVSVMAEIMVGLQLLTIACYGPRNFYRDISASIGKKVNFFGYYILGHSANLPWLLVILGVVITLIKHLKAGKPLRELLHPDPMHPSIRYKVPPPLGCLFGLKPIEAMPSAMGDGDKVVEFPEK
ncbi:hypothetical protein PMAYCL1PPCAC_08162, partial [Pristionchus mayeri]